MKITTTTIIARTQPNSAVERSPHQLDHSPSPSMGARLINTIMTSKITWTHYVIHSRRRGGRGGTDWLGDWAEWMSRWVSRRDE